jgi:hypothetical protein
MKVQFLKQFGIHDKNDIVTCNNPNYINLLVNNGGIYKNESLKIDDLINDGVVKIVKR